MNFLKKLVSNFKYYFLNTMPKKLNTLTNIVGFNQNNSVDVNERKFQKALQIIERVAAMGVTNKEELPYYKIN